MSGDVTLCTVSRNARDAAALMWESYLEHHERPVLFVYDNGSTDGAAEYLGSRADYFHRSEAASTHGAGLDHLCPLVETPYTLVVDTDVEFLAPTVGVMKGADAFAAHQARWFSDDSAYGFNEFHGDMYARLWGFQVYAALFRTAELQGLLRHVSFRPLARPGPPMPHHCYDTGAMLYHVALAAGLRVAEIDLTGHIIHYGSITLALYSEYSQYVPHLAQYKRGQYDIIRSRLRTLREGRSRRGGAATP